MKSGEDIWPEDADGDVFRRLLGSQFDFEATHNIDFNVDFNFWPPPEQFVVQLKGNYPSTKLVAPDGESGGYVTFIVHRKLTYQLVTFVQDSVSELAAPFGGRCESWGVWQSESGSP